tara:strand:+ start:28 stop:516 length:489 start_codon:yes stop_codon:yes gene_type:complete
MTQKGFTLIELLVVVAIIGVLAAVGVVAFQGFLNSTKENSAKAQHKSVVNFMQAQFTKCSLGETELSYSKPNWNGSAWEVITISESCQSIADIHAQKFDDHFEAEGFLSPFNPGARAVERHNGPSNPTMDGQIYIYCPSDSKCEIRTKINNSLWLKDIVSKE